MSLWEVSWNYRYGCAKNLPTHQTQSDSTRPDGLGRFLGLGRLGYKKLFYSRSGCGWIIKLQTRQTRPDLPIF